jgi:thiamine kinase-like enzyme
LPDFHLFWIVVYLHISNRLKTKINLDLQTLVHGDLYKANILTKSRINYYIDFEFSGKGHPARDLALILLNGYDSKKVFSIYR